MAISSLLFKANPNLREFSQPMVDPAKSAEWNAAQRADAQAAMKAGLPSFEATSTDSPSRLRLIDAVSRSHEAGYKFPYFIGTPTEPTGDRGMTMDIENLVKALQAQQADALKNGDKGLFNKIAKEKAFWDKEVADGMSAKEWKSQTGQGDPVYPTLGQ